MLFRGQEIFHIYIRRGMGFSQFQTHRHRESMQLSLNISWRSEASMETQTHQSRSQRAVLLSSGYEIFLKFISFQFTDRQTDKQMKMTNGFNQVWADQQTWQRSRRKQTELEGGGGRQEEQQQEKQSICKLKALVSLGIHFCIQETITPQV